MNQEIKERVEKIRNGEVPEGYKETKVGIIPVEWNVKKLVL
jgi:type I restriction enzyme S subunit